MSDSIEIHWLNLRHIFPHARCAVCLIRYLLRLKIEAIDMTLVSYLFLYNVYIVYILYIQICKQYIILEAFLLHEDCDDQKHAHSAYRYFYC